MFKPYARAKGLRSWHNSIHFLTVSQSLGAETKFTGERIVDIAVRPFGADGSQMLEVNRRPARHIRRVSFDSIVLEAHCCGVCEGLAQLAGRQDYLDSRPAMWYDTQIAEGTIRSLGGPEYVSARVGIMRSSEEGHEVPDGGRITTVARGTNIERHCTEAMCVVVASPRNEDLAVAPAAEEIDGVRAVRKADSR